LHCMLTGGLPFKVSNPIELFTVIRENEYVYYFDRLVLGR
jgi:hypothetical protein